MKEYAKTKEDREKLGKTISEIVRAGLEDRSPSENWWRVVWGYNRDEWQGSGDTDEQGDGSAIHIPIQSPRTDGVVSQIRSISLGQNPLMSCTSSDGSTETETFAATIQHRMWVAGGVRQAVDEAALNAAIVNRSIIEVQFYVDTNGKLQAPKGNAQVAEMAKRMQAAVDALTPTQQSQSESDSIQDAFVGYLSYAGLKFASIKPTNFVIYPSQNVGITNCKLCGKKFTLLYEQVEELQNRGYYFKDDPIPNNGNTDDDAEMDPQSQQTTAPSKNLQKVELYEVYVKMPLDNNFSGWYQAIVCPDTNQLFRFKPHGHSRPPYFIGECIVTDSELFWPDRSIARQLAPIQNQVDNLSGMIYDATAQALKKIVFGVAPPVKTDEMNIAGIDYIELDPGSPPPVQIDFATDVSTLFQQEQQLIQIADSLSVSSNNLSQPDQKEITATQTQAIESGTQARINSFIGRFTREWPQMAAYTWELLSDPNAQLLWAPLFLTMEEFQKAEDLGVASQRFSWTVAGQSIYDGPAQRLAVIQQIAAMAQDPAYGFNKYAIGRLLLDLQRMPGADGLQYSQQEMQQMQAAQAQQDAQQQAQGNSKGKPGMGGNQGPSLRPQTGANGQSLPPQPESTVRPGR